MLRTAFACAALLTAAYAGATWLTHDFQAWTAEDARRLQVARQPVVAPPVPVEGPGLAAQPLPRLLGDGQVRVVDFFYTRCESVCLALGTTFQQMQARLRERGDAGVRLLSVSFDGRDSVDDLRAYARRQRADPAHWQFVRATDPAATQRLLERFQVVVVPAGRDFEHNAALLVVDRTGRLVRIFDAADHRLALDYALHLAEGGAP